MHGLLCLRPRHHNKGNLVYSSVKGLFAFKAFQGANLAPTCLAVPVPTTGVNEQVFLLPDLEQRLPSLLDLMEQVRHMHFMNIRAT